MKKIKVGILGLGRAGWGMHGPELDRRKDKFEIVACCDTDPKRLKRFADKYHCSAYSDARDLAADPQVELFDVASRTPEHVEHAIMGLRAGKHVFLEKPIAVTYEQAKKLVPEAKKAKGKLFIRHNRRFESGFQYVLTVIRSGILGEVYEIKLRRNGYSRRDDWQTVLNRGGGQLLNWGPHIIDHALQFLNSPVVEQWSDLKKIAAVGDAEDHVHVVLRGQKGCLVELQISGGAAIGEPEYFILGTKGAMHGSGDDFKVRYLDPKNKLITRRPKPELLMDGFGSPDNLKWIEKDLSVATQSGPRLTYTIWDHLYASVRSGKKFPISLDQALEVMRVISEAAKGTKFQRKL